jgi:hypothetical protein
MQPFETALVMTPPADLTVVVNTCDLFEDCWPAFFTLYAKYGAALEAPIVLNTEKKTYHHSGLTIRSAQVARGVDRRLTWSECLAACLDSIQSPFVLYLQEDFFIESAVDVKTLNALVTELREGRADVIRIMECGGSGPWHSTENPLLWRVDQRAQYRIALQAALWRKDTLRAQLRAHESPWQLEVYGSARARRNTKERVFCLNRDRFHGPGKEVIPYTPTGVVKGKWEKFVPALFEREGIAMDFSKRGFFVPGAAAKRAPFVKRATDRLRSWL